VKRWQKTHLRGTAQDRIQSSEPGRAAKTGQNRRWSQGKRRRRKNNPSERSHAKGRSREGREPIKADRTDGSLRPLCLCVSVVKPPGSEGLDLRPAKAVGPPRHRGTEPNLRTAPSSSRLGGFALQISARGHSLTLAATGLFPGFLAPADFRFWMTMSLRSVTRFWIGNRCPTKPPPRELD
jgi:hypothetical protein